MKFTSIFVFLIPLVVARHHHRTLLETILKSKGNFFTKVNEDVQNVINSIFDTLSLEPTFPTKTRIKLLLTMHYDLNSISEENFDVYSNMINETKINNEKKSSNKIELYELIEEIFNDKSFNLSETITDLNQTYKQAKFKDLELESNETDAEFEDSKEFMQFIQDFIHKVDNISVNDFTKQLPPEAPPDNFTDTNLEIWRPPAVIELDFVNDTTARRIYRGKRTNIRSYPFIVSIHISGVFSCSGSIISTDLIITAASCLQLLYNNRFFRENPRVIYVRIGSDYYIKGGEKIDVVETYFHPSYDPKTLNNNLVILRLQKVIKFIRKQDKIRRILFDKLPQHLPSNTDGILILGWGSRKVPSMVKQFQKLTVAKLDVYPIDECAEIYSSHYVTDKHFCAGFLSAGGGACNKDVGGPGVVDGMLTGVVSFGPPVCGAVDAPTVFTKLGHYSNWISSILRMQPAQIGVRTTLLPVVTQRRPIFPKKPTRMAITPVITESYRAQITAKSDDILALKNVLKELAQTNSSLLYDLLYGDLDDDFHDIFKPAEKVQDIQHPLVNKSLYMIPDIHTFGSDPSNYVTIPLTTSSSTLPPTTTAEPTRNKPVTTHAPVTSPETSTKRVEVRTLREANKGERDYNSEYELLSTQSELQSGKEDELAPDQKYYSYEEATTLRPIGRMKKRHPRHRHQRLHRKKRRQRMPRIHKYSDYSWERDESAKHYVITPVNDLDNQSTEDDYDEDLSYSE